MTFLSGLHGTVATVLISALLFIDEAGVPLPFAPNEVLLLFAGLLMTTGGLSPFEFYPVALLAMSGGVMTGYGWARAIGPERLRSFAKRARSAAAFDRVAARMQRSAPLDIGIARMIPGVRVYTTLICGATGVPQRTFAAGALPATAVWCVVCTLLGVLVGVPAEHLLTELQTLLFTGGVFVVLGGACLIAARQVPSSDPRLEALHAVPKAGRAVLAIGLDLGIVASFTAGADRITRYFLGRARPDGHFDLVALLVVVTVAYILASRRIPGATAGEGLFDINYRTVPLRWRVRKHGARRFGLHIEPRRKPAPPVPDAAGDPPIDVARTG